jgi:hypothetical protein
MSTSAEILAELRQLGARGAVIVGTCNITRIPEVSRAWGWRVSRDGEAIEACVYARSGQRTVANVAENDRAAVTVTSATTYRSFQVKGRATVRLADDDDLGRVAEHQQAFLDEVVSIGLPREAAINLFEPEKLASPEMMTIRVALDEVFDQTPGPGAGARL